jgi:4a-hydroxytetrahydrobiopterin dehydratase
MECLVDKHCEPCHGGVPRLEAEEAARLLGQLEGWEVVEGHHLSKQYGFPNFAAALDYVNRVGAVAEAEGHHPDVEFGWGYARLKIYTHAIGGLSENDFILAARVDALEG